MNTIQLGDSITALYNGKMTGSEVLFFQRNVGLIGRINVLEKGKRVEHRLMRAMSKIAGETSAQEHRQTRHLAQYPPISIRATAIRK